MRTGKLEACKLVDLLCRSLPEGAASKTEKLELKKLVLATGVVKFESRPPTLQSLRFGYCCEKLPVMSFGR